VSWRIARDERLSKWLLGDEQAIELVQMLGNISEVWDDLIDEESVPDEQVHLAMTAALLHLPRNPWWARAQPFIHPVLIMATNAWLDSVDMERSDNPKLKERAFCLRDMCIEVIPMMAYLVGGWAHMRKVSLDMREFFAHESFDDWEYSK
jgi:hypothetical protein